MMPHTAHGKLYLFLWKLNLHVTKHGHLSKLNIYTTQNLAVEASYTIHKNNITDTTSCLISKCIVANFVILSVTLYFAGIAMLNKVDNNYTAST